MTSNSRLLSDAYVSALKRASFSAPKREVRARVWVTSVNRRRLTYAVAIGVASGMAVCALAFFVPQNPIVNSLLYLGLPLAFALRELLPSAVASWLFPGGGPGAGLALLMLSSAVTACAVFIAIAHFDLD